MLPFSLKNARPASRPLAGRSYWQRHGGAPAAEGQREPAPALPPRTDFCVVGGGLAGLATALALREAEPGAAVTVLEANFIGFGASGRNAGLLSPLPAPLWLASANGDAEHLWGLRHLNARVHDTAKWLSSVAPSSRVEPRPLRIDAQGHLTATGLARVAKLLGKGGLQHREVRSTAGSYAVELDTHTIDPYLTVSSLGARAREKGIVIAEYKPVRSIEETPTGVSIRLASGREFQARKAILCTNAYSGSIALSAKIPAKVVYNFMVATDRSPASASGDITGKPPFVVELNFSYVYYREHDGHVIYGGIERFKPYGSSDFDVPPDVLASIEKLLTRSFPGQPITPTEAWGGIYHQTSTDLPVIEQVGARGDIVVNAGYGGTGVAMTLICGRLAAALARSGKFADQEDKRLLDAMRSTRVPIGALARFIGEVAGDVLLMRRPRVSS